MKKHAYLIMAHNEFEVLNYLVKAIDYEKNDVFIHIDAKVEKVPDITASKSKIYFLQNRIDVRWGDVSMVEAELNLFETASKTGEYRYYHLLSGVDFPIKSAKYIYDFFKRNDGKEFIGYTQGDVESEINLKMRRYHLFSKEFRGRSNLKGFSIRVIRKVFLEIQAKLGIKRHKDIVFKKGTQWVSITSDLVSRILSEKDEIMKVYTHTFCADEIFIQTICWNSHFRECVYDLKNSRNSSKRMIQWIDNEIVDWGKDDVAFLLESSGIFARKFSKNNIEVVKSIFEEIHLKK